MTRGGELAKPVDVALDLLQRDLGEAHGEALMLVVEPDQDRAFLDPLLGAEPNLDYLARDLGVDGGGFERVAGSHRADDETIRRQRERLDQDTGSRDPLGATLARFGAVLGAREPHPAAGHEGGEHGGDGDLLSKPHTRWPVQGCVKPVRTRDG